MREKIDDENNVHYYISLDNLNTEEITNLFKEDRELKMFNTVLLYSNRDLINSDAENKLNRLSFSVIKQDNKIYIRDKKSNKRFHFKY